MADPSLRFEDIEEEISEDEQEWVDDGIDINIDENSPLTSLEELRSRVRHLVKLRVERDKTKATATKAKEAFDQYQAELLEEYRKSPLKGSIRVDLGDDLGTVQLVPRATKFGRVLDYDKAREYFKSRNKDNEYIKEEFRMGRLHELVREHTEQKKPLPDGIDFYTKEFFTITFK